MKTCLITSIVLLLFNFSIAQSGVIHVDFEITNNVSEIKENQFKDISISGYLKEAEIATVSKDLLVFKNQLFFLNGFLTKRISVNNILPKDPVTFTYNYEYDKPNKVYSMVGNSVSKKKTKNFQKKEFNIHGNKMLQFSFNKNEYQKRETSKGLVVVGNESLELVEDTKIKHTYKGIFTPECYKIYSLKGQLLEHKGEYLHENFKYFQDGLLMEVLEVENPNKKTIYYYNIDKHGNWIQKLKIKSSPNEVASQTLKLYSRKLTYNNGEITGSVDFDLDFVKVHVEKYNNETYVNTNNSTVLKTGCVSGNCDEGEGRFQYKNGVYQGGLKFGGKRHGKGTYVWNDGSSYVGDWSVGQKNGKGVYNFKDGSKYDGYWMADKRSGKGKMMWNDGTIYDGYWRNGAYHDFGKEYNANGVIEFDGLYKRGVRIMETTVFCKALKDFINLAITEREQFKLEEKGFSWFGEVLQKKFLDKFLIYKDSNNKFDITFPSKKINNLPFESGDVFSFLQKSNDFKQVKGYSTAEDFIYKGVRINLLGFDSMKKSIASLKLDFTKQEDINTNKTKNPVPNGLVWKKTEGDKSFWLYDNKVSLLEGSINYSLGNHLYLYLPNKQKLFLLENFKTQTANSYHKAEKIFENVDLGFWYKSGESGVKIFNANGIRIRNIDKSKYATNGIDVISSLKKESTSFLLKNYKNVENNKMYLVEMFQDFAKVDGCLSGDCLNGFGKIKLESGEMYEGDFFNGLKHGKGTLVFEDGSKYIGEFKEDYVEGNGKIFLKGKLTYEGQWQKSKYHGKGTLYSGENNEDKYVGGFKESLMHGDAKMYYKDILIFEGKYVNNILDGDAIMYDNNKNLKRYVVYKNGKIDQVIKTEAIKVESTTHEDSDINFCKSQENEAECLASKIDEHVNILEAKGSTSKEIDDFLFNKLNTLANYNIEVLYEVLMDVDKNSTFKKSQLLIKKLPQNQQNKLKEMANNVLQNYAKQQAEYRRKQANKN